MLCLGSNPSKTAHCSYDKSLNMANRALPDLPLCALSATYHPVSHCSLCFDQARRFSAPPSHVDSQFQVLTHDIPSVWNITVHFQNTKTNTHTHTHTHIHCTSCFFMQLVIISALRTVSLQSLELSFKIAVCIGGWVDEARVSFILESQEFSCF